MASVKDFGGPSISDWRPAGVRAGALLSDPEPAAGFF